MTINKRLMGVDAEGFLSFWLSSLLIYETWIAQALFKSLLEGLSKLSIAERFYVVVLMSGRFPC